MALELVRKFVNGAFRYVLEEEETGGDDSGGSTPGTVRLLDLGVVDVVELFNEEPATLYTPDEGELVGPVFLRDVTLTGLGDYIVVVAPEEGGRALAAFDNDAINEGYATAVANADDRDNAMPLATAALLVGLSESLDELVPATFPPRDGWEASHVYPQFAVVIYEVDHQWYADPGGTSGLVKPDFAGNIGGTVTDNDITWNDNGAFPLSGSAHVYAHVALPAAP